MNRPSPLHPSLATALAAVVLSLTALPGIARAGGDPIDDPIPDPIPLAPREIGLEVVADGLTAPNTGTWAPGLDPRVFFVTDQDGIVWQIDLAGSARRSFLDVSGRLVDLGIAGPGSFDERGLLGLAFHPAYVTNGLFYLYTSEPALPDPDFSTMPDGVDPDHQSVLSEWHVPNPTDPRSLPDPASVRVLLRIDEPQFNHNGGELVFGPDGYLYIALGDGGAGDDEGDGHGTDGNGRDPSTVLGTILRIDPRGTNALNGQYGVPADNPFVGAGPPFGGQGGCDDDGFCDEIWMYGLRNPFRFSFDRASGKLIVGDVGQNDLEEINLGARGGNYGWNHKEGTFCFDGNGAGDGFVTECLPGEVPPDLIDPVAQYDHDEGLAILGGFLYRGSGIPGLAGRYLFGDFARTFALDGRLFVIGPGGDIFELLTTGGMALNQFLLGFGEDAAGEVYLMTNSTGTPFEETGQVLKLVASP